MVKTRAMADQDERFQQLFALMKEMKEGQDEMKKGQEEMKKSQDKIVEGQDEMKDEMKKELKEMNERQDEMKDEMKKELKEMNERQDEMKDEIKKEMKEMNERQDEMKKELSKRQDEMKNELVNAVNARVDEIDEKIVTLGAEIERLQEFEKSAQGKFEYLEHAIEKNAEEKFERLEQAFEKRLKEEIVKVQGTPRSIENELEDYGEQQIIQQMPMANQPSIKLSTYDGKTSWQVFRTQFSIVAEANGWDSITKARQLAASLRAEASEILRTLPENQPLNFDSLSNALELRFGEKCLKDYSRLQLKSRLQKPNETFQEFATDIERLSHLAFSDCPTEVRELLSLQSFVDGVRDAEIQKALRMAEIKDLKSALVYAMKFEAAQQASRRDRHTIRVANIEDESDSILKSIERRLEKKMEEQFKRLSKQANISPPSRTGQKTTICWRCGAEGHIQRLCQANHDRLAKDPPQNHQPEN